jgi:hypothetical protein
MTVSAVQSEMQMSVVLRSKLARKSVVGLGCFFVLFAAVATQVIDTSTSLTNPIFTMQLSYVCVWLLLIISYGGC